jgi:ATP-dependent Clp protease ATP-binding subunit ClpC
VIPIGASAARRHPLPAESPTAPPACYIAQPVRVISGQLPLKIDPANPDRLTDRAKSVFVRAEAVAMGRGADEIAPEDLLLALARCDRGVGRTILEGFAIELDKLQEELKPLAPRAGIEPFRPVALGFSPAALRVLAWAKEEAAALNHMYLGTEHLVLGLLCDETSSAGAFLRARSASSERARQMVRSLLHPNEGS